MLRRHRRAALVLAGLALLLAGLLSGCNWGGDKANEPFRDAPRGQTVNTEADVYTMPDGFTNIATKCGPPGVRLISAFHGNDNRAAISAVLDPACGR